MGHNASLHAWLAAATGPQSARIVVAIVFALVMAWVLRRNPPLLDGGLVLTGAFLLLTPTLHPWYATWIIPFLVFRPGRPWIALSLLVGVAYAAYGLRATTGVFHLTRWMRGVEWAPVYLWLVVDGVRSRRAR
ncbi:MAG: hypothetical protein R3E12_12835 [Candidatus Eisenbacteria bacterium]